MESAGPTYAKRTKIRNFTTAATQLLDICYPLPWCSVELDFSNLPVDSAEFSIDSAIFWYFPNPYKLTKKSSVLRALQSALVAWYIKKSKVNDTNLSQFNIAKISR